MAIRLPKPKKSQPLPPIEPSFDNIQSLDDITEFETSNLSLSNLNQEFNDNRFFDWHGRISRLQFLVYSTFNLLICLLILALIFVMIGGFQGIFAASGENLSISLLGAVCLAVAILSYLQFAITKRRFNDLNKTGWLALVMIVPGVNILAYLYLLAMEGTVGANYYGLPARPATNLKAVLIVLIPLLVISLIGISTQVIMPSYQAFVNSKKGENNSIAAQPKQIQAPKSLPNNDNPQSISASNVAPENLRKEVVVITGEQLGNGIASTPKSVEQNNTNTVLSTTSKTDTITANNSTALNEADNQPNNLPPTATPPNQIESQTAPSGVEATSNSSSNKGSVSYEDFIKSSEQQVFIERK